MSTTNLSHWKTDTAQQMRYKFAKVFPMEIIYWLTYFVCSCANYGILFSSFRTQKNLSRGSTERLFAPRMCLGRLNLQRINLSNGKIQSERTLDSFVYWPQCAAPHLDLFLIVRYAKTPLCV